MGLLQAVIEVLLDDKQVTTKLNELPQKVEGSISKTKSGFAKIGNNFAELGTKASDFSKRAGESISAFGKKVEDVGDKFTQAGKKTAFLSASAGAVFGVATKSASDFTNGMAKMSTLFDTSQTSVKKLSNEFLNLSNETGKSATELAEAGYQALSAGVSVDKVGSFIKTSAKFAKVGFTETSNAVDVLTTSINAYHLKAEDAESIANKLVRTQNLGKTTIDELSSSMGRVIPTASAMNVNIDNLASSYVTLTKQGISTRIATTQISAMLDELGDSSSNVAGVLKSKTGKSFQDLMGDGKSLGDVLMILKQYSKDTGTNFNELWANTTAGKGAMAIVNDEGKTFADSMQAMGSNADDLGTALDKLSTPSAKISKSLNKLKNSAIEMGQAFLVQALPFIEKFGQAVDSCTKWFNNLSPATKTVIADILLLVTAISPALLLIGKIVKTVGTVISFGGKLISGIGTLIGVISSINPAILGVIAVVTALVGVGILLYKNWDTIKKYAEEIWNAIASTISSVWDSIVETLTNVWDSIVQTVSDIWNSITETISNAWETIKTVVDLGIQFIVQLIQLAFDVITLPWQFIWQNFGDILVSAWETIKETVSSWIDTVAGVINDGFNAIAGFVGPIWETIKKTISGVIDTIATFISDTWNSITETLTGVWNTIKDTASSVWESISTTVSSVWESIKQVTSSVWNGIKSTISSIWNGITGAVSSAINTVSSTVSGVWNGIKSTTSSVWNSIKSAIETPINTAKDTVKNVIDKIKGFFNFSWSLPKLKLPHLSIDGEFSLTPPSVPKFGIKWYKRAYDEAMALNGATIFGASNGQLLGGGEGNGAEYISGKEGIKSAVREVLQELKLDVYLDGNTLVGSIIERIDKALYMRQLKGVRGL